MKCNNCGKENPPNSKYCVNCGTNFEEQRNTPNNEKSRTNLLIFIGAVIIIILVCLLGLGIYGLMTVNNENTNTVTILNSSDGNAENQKSISGSWHKVRTYNGVYSDSIAVTTQGTKFKVISTAMPMKNYASNYMYTTVLSNGYTIGSSNLDWNSKSAVATKTKTLEFSGSGTHYIDISAYELQWWTIEVWEYY